MYTMMCDKVVKSLPVLLGLCIIVLCLHKPVKAQVSAFLISPYYGVKTIAQNYSTSHPALDLSLNYEQVLAASDGTVNDVNWFNDNCHWSATDSNCGLGLYIRIDHPNGYRTYYAHLSAAAYSRGTTGTAVFSGQIIGSSGATGWTYNGSNGPGPHLHFEVRNGATTYVNPFASNLWKDGQWASPSRPIPVPATISTNDIIVDDTTDNTGGFRKGGGGYPNNSCIGNCQNWTGVGSGYGSDMYATPTDRVNNSVDQWAEWTPSGMPSEGAIYEVFVYVPNTNATSWQAPLVITYLNSSGNWTTKATTIDQNDLNNQWISVGAYRMKPGAYVWTHDATGEIFNQHCSGNWCQLGIDAVKFVRRGTVYAPDARYNNGGWTSKVTIRNNGGGLATMLIKALQSNGVAACTTNAPTLFAHQSLTYSCPSTSVASFIIEADQDMSVVVSQERSSPYTHEAYAGVDNPTSEVLVPIVQRNNSGWYSDLFIQNAGSTNTSVNLQFMGAAGGCILTPCTYNNQATIAPGARVSLALSSYTVDGFYGTVRVTNSANQPLAVASMQYFDNGSVSLLMETSNS